MKRKNPRPFDDLLPLLDLFTTRQTAQLTRFSENQLWLDRKRGRGIPYIQLSPKKIFYRLEDINKYMAEHWVEPGIGHNNQRLPGKK